MRDQDICAAANLLICSTEEELRPYFTYCQPRIGAYLAAILASPQIFSKYYMYVAVDESDEVVGFAEVRTTGRAQCILTYVCVAPKVRGKGLAARLLAEHLAAQPGVRAVELDVSLDNTSALRLYKRLGFTAVDTVYWWTRELPEPETGAAAEIEIFDWHVSVANMKLYGFCRFSADYRSRRLGLGLVSPTVLRVASPHQLQDDRLLAGLRVLLPSTKTALATDSTLCDPTDSRLHLLLEYRRMYVTSASLMGNL
jgi:GNAT superfamily N-acetyltransferase